MEYGTYTKLFTLEEMLTKSPDELADLTHDKVSIIQDVLYVPAKTGENLYLRIVEDIRRVSGEWSNGIFMVNKVDRDLLDEMMEEEFDMFERYGDEICIIKKSGYIPHTEFGPCKVVMLFTDKSIWIKRLELTEEDNERFRVFVDTYVMDKMKTTLN